MSRGVASTMFVAVVLLAVVTIPAGAQHQDVESDCLTKLDAFVTDIDGV